ncbi:MAG: hemolysin III family protein [Chitinophagales bacterium]|nr:hemolysin III family protein [Chitinophagales bacterium]MDW8418794.1 hemolysin III family protein [Chitinophagales bacterium]
MKHRDQTPAEEIANAITHGTGVLFTLIAMPFLIYSAVQHDTIRAVWAVSVYGAGMFMVYLSSTLYHAIRRPSAKRALRVWDHISIFLLIGGTYTAVVQKYTSQHTAVIFLSIMWGIIAAGSILKLFFTGRFKAIELGLYLGLGWMAIFIIKPLHANLPTNIFWWLLAGGLFYTSGVIFYTWKKLKYHHAIWHCFVLGGTVMHFIAVYQGTTLRIAAP